jgi:hypothetical protein
MRLTQAELTQEQVLHQSNYAGLLEAVGRNISYKREAFHYQTHSQDDDNRLFAFLSMRYFAEDDDRVFQHSDDCCLNDADSSRVDNIEQLGDNEIDAISDEHEVQSTDEQEESTRATKVIRNLDDLARYPTMMQAIATILPEGYNPHTVARTSILAGTNLLVDEWNDAMATQNPSNEQLLTSHDNFADVDDENGYLQGITVHFINCFQNLPFLQEYSQLRFSMSSMTTKRLLINCDLKSVISPSSFEIWTWRPG